MFSMDDREVCWLRRSRNHHDECLDFESARKKNEISKQQNDLWDKFLLTIDALNVIPYGTAEFWSVDILTPRERLVG